MDIIRVLQEYWPSFCKALMITLEMTVFSLIFATIIGTIVGLFNVSKIKPLQFIANIYIDIVRGTPLLVQVFIMYYGLTQFLQFQWPAMEAARSLGLPYKKAMWKIILPQAFRTMLPSIINQFIISLKDTSLISVIGPRELTQNGKIIAANSSTRVMAIWIVVALFYLVVCTILSRVAKLVERKVSYGK